MSSIEKRETDAGRFAPGYVLAGRYRMIAILGKGGMGEVWRADDLVLETPVALKLIYSGDQEGRGRILNEVRLARQITHPAVCRVFDVGQGEGEIFYSMELVQGEDLATLVRRAGRLPPEKVIDIGRQLCGGLAAAHAQGVLHRDLKPANVLIDEEGLVRITDFGIAVTRDETGHGTLIGTPGYMAPEQLQGRARLSERTDIYALGLILYELLVGQPAFENRMSADQQPAKPSLLISGVDLRLERAILKAIAPDPRDRPASAGDMSELLIPSRRTWPGMKPWTAAAAVAAIAAIAAASLFVRPRGSPLLTSQDTIMVADFTNTTGDPVFDGALKVALAVALEQSPFLKVFPDDRVRGTLRLMQRPEDERVTPAIAREIARREQLKALVSGSIATLGSHYVLALEAINAETGDVFAREQIEVQAKEQVLASLGAASSRLREKLGESLAVIEKFDVPLAQATTGSLDALHAYSLALDQGRMNPRVEAIPHLRRAIELDPNFAMAHALMSGTYRNIGRSADAPEFARKAFELRDRVSERERFFISWRYYLDAEQAWDKALNLALEWTRTYPREAFAFNSLGIASAAFGQHEQAVTALQEAIRLDDRFAPPHGNLAGSLIALGRFDEARARVRDAAARGVDFITVRRMSYLLAFLVGDSTAIARELDWVRTSPQAMWASTWEARTAGAAGRIQRAHELFEQGVEGALREGFAELAAQWKTEDAEFHAVADQCPQARNEIAAGLQLSRDNFTLERASRVLALCNLGDESAKLSDELRRRFSNATLTLRMQLPVTAAALAVRRGEFARAIELLTPVMPYDEAPAAEFWPPYLRGTAYLGLKNGRAAAVQFQNITARRGAAPTSPLYGLAQNGLARATAMSDQPERARQ
jgi:eukaryotic-like serine/threonine-protein kinase